ncbi:MAG TPA: alpha/beta hydrolase [Stellaceae bacterium]|nr:alpha/beta hydrolase [Stellaceae bacterium]
MSFRERRVSAQDGLSLYFRDYGDPLTPGMPLLCLSGISRNSKDFHKLATRHAGRRRVICPDYRGRGQSARDPNWRNYMPATYLGDIGQILTVCDVGPVVVIGTSLGGLLGMGLAAFRPMMVAGIVLNDIGPELGGGLGRIMTTIGIDQPQPDWAAATAFVKLTMPKLGDKTDEAWLEMAQATFREAPDGLLRYDWDINLARALIAGREPQRDLWPVFRGLGQRPALVIRGGVSDILTEGGLERMVAVKPDLKTVTVPDVGHTPNLSEPIAEQAIDAFLDQF